ncbi:MAG: hypoxanthine phosphoribosyltransferase [Gemmatimonadetes bacterium]|nr:hypoxanthine phosphoribosyltransferase [Gemmatimonadota bacterium]
MTQQPEVLISETKIDQRVSELAAQISADYAGAGELALVGVLRGAFVFLADLSRRLTIPRRVDFMALSSYGARASTRPDAVRLVMDLSSDVSGRHVLVVEDIVDTGHTLRYLLDVLAARNPASLKSCALVRKAARSEVEVAVDYLGFDIPDVWVVGYGLDYADQWRTLPYIGIVRSEK